MTTHQAAFLDTVGQPLEIRQTTRPTPAANEVLIKNSALAINPIDWKQQDTGAYIQSFPTILGTDVAGEVFAIGSSVTRFKPGQRVIGHGITLATGNSGNGAFQEYTICPEAAVSVIPDDMKFEDAVVLPLAVSTAAAGLFEKKHLGLEVPDKEGRHEGETVLIWGGSSSVGSLAIQLAKAAGYNVLATASKRNFDFVLDLGAKSFDYQDGRVVENVVAELQKSSLVGIFDAISEGNTGELCAQVASKLGGGKIASALSPPEKLLLCVAADMVFAPTVFLADPEVGEAVWAKFLPQALIDGKVKPTPTTEVFGKGLSAIQGAMERHKKGVSARKIVVTL